MKPEKGVVLDSFSRPGPPFSGVEVGKSNPYVSTLFVFFRTWNFRSSVEMAKSETQDAAVLSQRPSPSVYSLPTASLAALGSSPREWGRGVCLG